METDRPVTALDPRATRALALMVVCTLALSLVVVVYLRTDLLGRPTAASPPTASQPELGSDMTWISYREGWLSALDRQAGTTTLFHTSDAGRHWTPIRF